MEAEKRWEMDRETQRNDKAKDSKEQKSISNTSNICETKKGRPEEENFSKETGLPDYPAGLTGVHIQDPVVVTPDRVDKVIAVLQLPHGTSHVVFQLNLCQEQLYLPSTLSCDPSDGVIPVGLLNSGGSGGWRHVRCKCRSTISNSKEI
jgi:hypothetical protein